MLTVYDCLVNQHDLRLVALAVVVCAFASTTAFNLLAHVRRSKGRRRQVWLFIAVVSTGFGIWATHFIAMLAFAPALDTGYDLVLTVASLVVAIVVTGLGMSVAIAWDGRHLAGTGGAIVGVGIALMHYLGMFAFEVPGRLVWDDALVWASVVSSVVLGGLALRVGLRDRGLARISAGATLLTLAICSHHFIAMGAVAIMPDPTRGVPASALSPGLLAAAAGVASVILLFLSFSGLILDLRDRRRTKLEKERMRSLADAAVEGLLVCDGETIVSANGSFVDLSGSPLEDIVGTGLRAHLPVTAALAKLFAEPNQAVEAELSHRTGEVIPVELIMRRVSYADKPHNVIAVRDLRDRKQAEARIHFLAHHDPLTELANRASFNHRLDLEIEAHDKSQQRLAVLCLDLDRFKEINDLFGHSAGDHLLRDAARRFSALLEEGQMIARLGGDEFAVIVPRLVDPVQAGRLAEAMIKALGGGKGESPFELVSISIGIAVYPDDAVQRAELLSNADAALYRAKKEGRGTYRFFEATMSEEVRERRSIEHDLRQAIERDELAIAYQPQTHIDTKEITGFEALLRWRHSERGDVSPGIFIPIAEESGAILKIGEWVLRMACAEAACWDRPLKIAVNVSAVQLNSPGFVGLVEEVLHQTGLEPERLELEITESVLIRDPDRALQTLEQLKDIGVSIAMDDFGTGYSSLSNLRNFPFDKIKIDRSFVRAIDMNRQAATIVRAVLGLGRGLGLPVIAEGVETAGELAFLNAEGCKEAQGYLFGRPAPIESFRTVTHVVAVA